jgi:HK97 family phage major capsid protein
LTPKLPNTSADLSGKIMLLFGDMSKAVALGSRREIALATSLSRYLDTDQLAYRITERFDIIPHNMGDNATAGAIVGLQGTA